MQSKVEKIVMHVRKYRYSSCKIIVNTILLKKSSKKVLVFVHSKVEKLVMHVRKYRYSSCKIIVNTILLKKKPKMDD